MVGRRGEEREEEKLEITKMKQENVNGNGGFRTFSGRCFVITNKGITQKDCYLSLVLDGAISLH